MSREELIRLKKEVEANLEQLKEIRQREWIRLLLAIRAKI